MSNLESCYLKEMRDECMVTVKFQVCLNHYQGTYWLEQVTWILLLSKAFVNLICHPWFRENRLFHHDYYYYYNNFLKLHSNLVQFIPIIVYGNFYWVLPSLTVYLDCFIHSISVCVLFRKGACFVKVLITIKMLNIIDWFI